MKPTIFRRKAVILMIVALMLLSASAATANTAKPKKYNASNANTLASYTPRTTSATAKILEEGFEEGTMPPSGGWYTIDDNTNSPWTIVDKPTYPDYVHSGQYSAWINYDSDFSSDNWLVSPDICLTGLTEVQLIFWIQADTNWPGATVELHIRGDGVDDVLWDLIADETWEDFIYREMTFSLDNYIGQTINISWRYVGFDGQSIGLDDILVWEPAYPDLDCEGELNWTDIEPGSTVENEFTVSNIGDAGSELNWEIFEYPDWGNWTFTPENGMDLTPDDSPFTVEVSVEAPDEQNQEFTGEIVIVNSDDPDDTCTISVSLATPVPKNLFFYNILEKLSNRFPLLEKLMGWM